MTNALEEARKSRLSGRGESARYSIRPYRHEGALVSVTLFDKKENRNVATVLAHNTGHLFQYGITVPQMNYLESLENEDKVRSRGHTYDEMRDSLLRAYKTQEKDFDGLLSYSRLYGELTQDEREKLKKDAEWKRLRMGKK